MGMLMATGRDEAVPGMQPVDIWTGWGFDYKSRAHIAGLPLVHVAFKYRPDRVRWRPRAFHPGVQRHRHGRKTAPAPVAAIHRAWRAGQFC